MLRSIPTNILYVDADARIRQYPKLFDDFDGDIGVHYRRGRELLSGTIFLRNNERVRMLVNFWQGEQMLRPETWDQKTLDYVIQARAENLGVKVVDLPPSYTQIFDSMAHHGAPVIEHMQASRRYKKLVTVVEDPTILKFPGVIGKVRIRQAADGTLYITRRDKQAETWLDVNAIRLKGQLRWFPIPPKTLDDLEKLKPEFQDKTICIVGKGPSLDNLRPEHFPKDATIIALNEAIHKVETLSLSHESVFCLQQDARLRDTCLPKQARILASVKAMNFYSQVKDRAFIFDARQWGLNMNALSVSAAIALARRFGARDFILLCFDACVNKKLDYAECVGYDATWGGKKERFLTHRRKIEYRLKSYPTKWVIPEVPVGTSVDRPQQS